MKKKMNKLAKKYDRKTQEISERNLKIEKTRKNWLKLAGYQFRIQKGLLFVFLAGDYNNSARSDENFTAKVADLTNNHR